jgi:hypothetical protein
MVLLALLAIAIGVLLALALVLVGLVEAPWPVLLVGLLAALYGLQRELIESQASSPLSDIERSQDMELSQHLPNPPAKPQEDPADNTPPDNAGQTDEVLTYRGIRYRVSRPDDHSNHDNDTLVEGIYRGQHWQRWRSTSDGPNHPADTSEITYRGKKVIKPGHEAQKNREV